MRQATRGEHRLELAPHALSFPARCEPRSREILAADRRAQQPPELVLERADGEPAPVGRAVDAVGRHATGKEVLAARLRRAPLLERVQGEDVVRERRIGHRDVDARALAGTLRPDQRGKDRDRGARGAPEQVGDLQVAQRGRPPRHAGLVEHSGIAEVVDVVAGHASARAVLAVAADRGEHHARVRRGERGVPDAERVDHAGAEALDDDVGAPREGEERPAAARVLEVDRDRALVAVHRPVERACGPAVRAERARIVAGTGVLDLDDVGAQIGEMERAHRPGQQPRQVEHAHAGERPMMWPDACGLRRCARFRSRRHRECRASAGSPSRRRAPRLASARGR